MTNPPGHLWALIQEWLDTFRYGKPSQNELAEAIGVSSSTLGDYKHVSTKGMPPPAFLVRLAKELKVPYERVLDAALQDWGYRGVGLAHVEAEVDRDADGPQVVPDIADEVG